MRQIPIPSGAIRPSSCRAARGLGLVRVVAASAAALMVAAGGIWALTRDGAKSADMRAVANLDLGKVELGSFAINTTAMGELEARKQIELRSQLDTRADIIEIVPEGSVVKKGDLLVQLNAEDLQEQINQQKLEVERGKADVTAAENALKIQISQNESSERAAQLKIDLADLALEQWREGEVVKTADKQSLDIAQAERDLKRLTEKFERSEQLLLEGFLSQNERDLDEIAMINAQAKLRTAQLDKDTYKAYQYPRDEKTKISDLEEARADLERVRTQNEINAGAKEASLATTRTQYELKVERLAKLEEQFGLAAIYAPTDGLVVYATSIGRGRDMIVMGGDGPLQVGREVRPNEQLIILPDTSSMVATVRVHESLAGRIRPGQRASITIDAMTDDSFFGTVESVGVLAESGGWRDPNRREYSVRIAIDHDNSDGKLKPSMRAEAEIMLAAVQQSLMVPVQAVFSEGPVKFVYRPQGSRFERVPVHVGRMSDTFAEVASGLAEGDRVLLREPGAGEVLPGEWSRAQLELAGVELGEDGKPITARRGEEMMRMMTEMGAAGGMDGMGGAPGQLTGAGQRPEGMPAGREAGQRPGGGQRPAGARPGGTREGRGAPPASGTPTTPATPPATPPASEQAATQSEPAREGQPAATETPPAATPAQKRQD